MALIGRRWLTPERLSIFLSSRASERDPLDDFADILGHVQLDGRRARSTLPASVMADAFFQRRGIMRADLRADAVLQRRDDLAARRVVLRIGAEHQRHVERQAHRIALNLHVAFLHDVEQADLDLCRPGPAVR